MKYSFATARKIVNFISNDYSLKIKDIAKQFNLKEYEVSQILIKYYGKSYSEIRKENFKKICKDISVEQASNMFKVCKHTILRWRKEFNCLKRTNKLNIKFLRKILKEFDWNAKNASIYYNLNYKAVIYAIHNNKKLLEEYKKNNPNSVKKKFGSKKYLKEVYDFINKKLPTLEEKILFCKYLGEKYNKNYKWILTYINKKLRRKYGVSRAD